MIVFLIFLCVANLILANKQRQRNNHEIAWFNLFAAVLCLISIIIQLIRL